MKSTRRHALQENVLAIEIGRIVEFLKKRGNHLATGLLVLALIVFGYVFLTRRAQSRRLELQLQWDRAVAGNPKPEERVSALTALAEQSDDERLAALAGVELGYEFASRALAARTDSEKSALLEKARSWYLVTLEKFPEQTLAVAKAHYGMAKILETVGQFKQAAEYYQRIKNVADLAGYPIAQLAEAGLRQIKSLQTPVNMAATAPATQPTSAPAPAPATQPTTRPATQPATQPATRPAGAGGTG